MNLLHLLDQSLIGRSDDPALEWQGRVYKFGELDARSNRVAHALQQRGFAKGDRLCVYLPNRGATGLEPATSGVTGRRLLVRVSELDRDVVV